MQYHEVAMLDDAALAAVFAEAMGRRRDPVAEFLHVPARRRGPLPDWAALAARSSGIPSRGLGE